MHVTVGTRIPDYYTLLGVASSAGQSIRYQLVRPENLPPAERFELLHLTADGKHVHTFRTHHEDHPDVVAWTSLYPVYEQLVGRHRYIKHQPDPMDDITGDGLPNLAIVELDPGGSAPGSTDYWVTVLTLRGYSVEVHQSFHGTGEVLFFDDLNGDGRLEFIGGELDYGELDGERRIPASPLVWVFDPVQRRYRNVGRSPVLAE